MGGFKHERMVGFCFHCGVIMHEVKYCERLRDRETQDYRYGEWLKVDYRRAGDAYRSRNQGQTTAHYKKSRFRQHFFFATILNPPL